jgi:hypothetical protein
MTDHTTSTTPPATTYVRHTVDRLTAETVKPGQDYSIWNYVHLSSIIGALDAMGHGALVREAADRAAAVYDLPSQADRDGLADGHRRLGGFGAVS